MTRPFERQPTRPASGPVWQNWAGNVSAHPQQFLFPQSEAELSQIVREAAAQKLRVRVVGAGHSFSETAASDDILLSIDRMTGLESYDPATGEASVWAGTRLYDLNKILAGLGRAQENMGDVNRQSVAGAISTGTHGTGLTLGSVGTQVEAVRLIDGQGQLRCIDRQQISTLAAARLSLGALGIITSVTLRTLKAYNLKMDIRAGRLDEMIALGQEYARAYRHFEFYWVPYTQAVQVKCCSQTEEQATPKGLMQNFNDVVLENAALGAMSEVNKAFPSSTQAICSLIGAVITPNSRVQASSDIFGSVRNVKFKEMEYAVPIAALPDTLRELRDLMQRRRFPISFPIEVRFVRGDDVLLSTAQGRDCAYIAIHAYRGVDADDYFREAEALFLAHQGRPHWGKCHTRSAADFAQMYPHFGEFRQIREQFDPQRRFGNAYLERVLGD